MLFSPSATVDPLCSMAEVAGGRIPAIPRRISAELNPTMVRSYFT